MPTSGNNHEPLPEAAELGGGLVTPHACPPVNDCQPDPQGTLAKSHAFAEGAARCDCGKRLNVGDHAAIVQAARAVVEEMAFTIAPDRVRAAIAVLADLLPALDEAGK